MDLPDPSRDRVIIADPGQWPLHDRLPLKRYRSGRPDPAKFGMLLLDDHGQAVPHVHLYEIAPHRPLDEVLRYATVEEMLADGWRVD